MWVVWKPSVHTSQNTNYFLAVLTSLLFLPSPSFILLAFLTHIGPSDRKGPHNHTTSCRHWREWVLAPRAPRRSFPAIAAPLSCSWAVATLQTFPKTLEQSQGDQTLHLTLSNFVKSNTVFWCFFSNQSIYYLKYPKSNIYFFFHS